MTQRQPLTDAFPWRSPLARRVPDGTVPELDMLIEVEAELARRNAPSGYPRLIAKQSLTEDAAARHIAVLAAIRDDLAALTRPLRAAVARAQGLPLAEAPVRAGPDFSWEDKVREIRRELALKRTALPRAVARVTHPLGEPEARRVLECWDALHWRYWAFLADWSDGEPARIAEIAGREAARARGPEWRDAAGEPGAGDPGQDWAAIAILARRIGEGRDVLSIVTPATLRRLHRTAAARAVLAQEACARTEPHSESRARLEPELLVCQLERWLARLDRLWGPLDPPQEIAA